MPPKIGQKVDVGGCVGKIKLVSQTKIKVVGRYYYTFGGEETKKAIYDDWTFFFDRQPFEAAGIDKWGLWNAKNIQPELG